MLNYDNSVTFSVGEQPAVEMVNFWGPEDGFIWSKNRWCEVTFGFDAGGASKLSMAELMLDLDVFRHVDGLPGQNVLIYLNGLRISSNFVSRRVNLISVVDSSVLKLSDNVLVLDTPESASPNAFGSSDNRQLGVQLYSLQIRRAG